MARTTFSLCDKTHRGPPVNLLVDCSSEGEMDSGQSDTDDTGVARPWVAGSVDHVVFARTRDTLIDNRHSSVPSLAATSRSAMQNDDLSILASHGLERRSGAAVIIDVVASVRRIETDELATVVGWVDTLKRITGELLPMFNGRLVKSLGDGALIEFSSSPEAVGAALAIQKLSSLPLRIGIEAGEYLSDVHDIYGRAVNRAARLMALSEEGCITISDGVRATLAAELDASIEDIGIHHLKHINEPVRAFRVGPPVFAKDMGIDPDGPVLPTLAIIPFSAGVPEQEIPGAGDILCDELIRLMSASPHLRIISRLSTTPFRNRVMPLPDVARRLNARFLLTGRYRKDGEAFRLEFDLVDGRTAAILWKGTTEARVGDIYAGALGFLEVIPSSVSRAIISRETRRAKSQELPTLENYSLLLAAISLTNSQMLSDFQTADRLFQHLLERLPQNSMVNVWRAFWYLLRIQQGWSSDIKGDGAVTKQHCLRALDTDPESSMALTMHGHVLALVDKDFSNSLMFSNEAIRINPNDPLAWLYRGSNLHFADEGPSAVTSIARALHIAPLDPSKFLYDCIAASAAYVNGDYAESERYTRLSLRANRLHASAWRVRVACLWMLERKNEAIEAARHLMDVEPTLTVNGWLHRSPMANNRVGLGFAECLRASGIPD
jgi:adenylate cyclase